MFSLFEVTSLLFNGIIKQIFRARLPVSNIWNNRFLHIIAFPRIIALLSMRKKETIAPGYYSRKYGTRSSLLMLVSWSQVTFKVTILIRSSLFQAFRWWGAKPLSPVPLYFSSLSLLCTTLHYLNAWNRLHQKLSLLCGCDRHPPF